MKINNKLIDYPDISVEFPKYNSTYISTIGYANVVRFGKLVIVNMNGQTSQNVPGATALFTDLPQVKYSSRALGSITFANNSSARVVAVGTEIRTCGAINFTGWFQGQIIYTTD